MPRALAQISLLVVLAAAGCAGYRLGPSNGEAAGNRSVEVSFFRNDTPQPRLAEAINPALRPAFQQDGTYRLSTQGDGDIVISGVLVKYERPPLSFEPKDTLTPRDYRINLTAKITATERITGRVLLDREATGPTGAPLTSRPSSWE